MEEEEEMQPPVDLKGLKVNELGKIMVLMYHGIGEEEDVWVRTPENFRKKIYRPCTTRDTGPLV